MKDYGFNNESVVMVTKRTAGYMQEREKHYDWLNAAAPVNRHCCSFVRHLNRIPRIIKRTERKFNNHCESFLVFRSITFHERERTKRLTEISIVWCCHWMILHFNIAVIKKWTVNRSLWLRRVNNKKRFDIGIWWHSELMKIYEYLNGLASSSMTFRFFRCGVFPNVHWHRSQMAVRIHILSMMKLLGRNITSNMDNVPELRAM